MYILLYINICIVYFTVCIHIVTIIGVFGPVDVGQNVYWWDYGQLKLYQKYNIQLATGTNHESEMMRSFFCLGDTQNIDSDIVNSVYCNIGSCYFSCNQYGNVSINLFNYGLM